MSSHTTRRTSHSSFILGFTLALAVGGIALFCYWKMSADYDPIASGVAAKLQTGRPTTRPVFPQQYRPPVRWLELEGVVNTRDIGGYVTADGRTICWNKVYRSGELKRLTDSGCEAFVKLGIRRVIDFRNRLGLSSAFGGDVDCVFDAAEMTLLPVRVVGIDHPDYLQILHANVDSFREAFTLMADPANLPLLYHCAAGKDRTGIMTVLLLSLLGVDRAPILQDYELSASVAGQIRPQDVLSLFDDIDIGGGIENYLVGLGVTPSTQEALRAQLLE